MSFRKHFFLKTSRHRLELLMHLKFRFKEGHEVLESQINGYRWPREGSGFPLARGYSTGLRYGSVALVYDPRNL
jgi:hypothetical protein